MRPSLFLAGGFPAFASPAAATAFYLYSLLRLIIPNKNPVVVPEIALVTNIIDNRESVCQPRLIISLKAFVLTVIIIIQSQHIVDF